MVCSFSSFVILPALQRAIPKKNCGHASFFVENPMKFLGMLLYPCHFRTKQGFIRGISVVLSTPLLKIPEPKKTKATGNSNFCSYHHRKFYVFFGNLAFYFFDTPRNSVSLTPSPFVIFLEQPNVKKQTQNKLETFFATSYKSHISKVESENYG